QAEQLQRGPSDPHRRQGGHTHQGDHRMTSSSGGESSPRTPIASLLALVLGLALCAGPALAADADDFRDVLYLGSGKPALIRLRVRPGGNRLHARWDEFMERLFNYLDANKSGGLDRLEARRIPTAQQMLQFFQGNVVNGGMMGRRERPNVAPPFEKLDINKRD